MKKVLDEMEFDNSANIQIPLFSWKLKSVTNLGPDDIKLIILAFNKWNKTHITSKDIFDIIDFIVKGDEGVGLECKYIICKAEQEWLQIKEYIKVKFGFDSNAPLLSKTILFGKCWDMLNLPDSCTKWLWDTLCKKAKASGRDNPNAEDFINLLNSFLRPDFMQEKSYTSPEEILAKLVRKMHRDYPAMTSIKDLLNILANQKNIKFTDPATLISLGTLIELFCDVAPLISAPECRQLFNYILTKYDSGSNQIHAYWLLNEILMVEKVGLWREIQQAVIKAEEETGIDLVQIVDEVDVLPKNEGIDTAKLRTKLLQTYKDWLDKEVINSISRIQQVSEMQEFLLHNTIWKQISVEL